MIVVNKNNFKFWETLDAYVINKLKTHTDRYHFGDSNFAFWPSEAATYKYIPNYGNVLVGKGCQRRIWYRYKNYEISNPMSIDGWYKAMMGKVVESFLFEQLKNAGQLVANNVKFYNQEYNISGEVDAIIKPDIKNDNEYIILELKTFDGYFSKRLLTGYFDRTKHIQVRGTPRDSHLLQAFLYDVLNHDDKIKYVKLIYLARDTVDRIEFDISHTTIDNRLYPVVNGIIRKDIDGSALFERYNKLNILLTLKTPPQREYQLQYDTKDIEKRYKAGLIFKTTYDKYIKKGIPIGDFECNYCSYKDLCWNIKSKVATVKLEEMPW